MTVSYKSGRIPRAEQKSTLLSTSSARVLMRPGLRALPEAFDIAVSKASPFGLENRKTLRRIRLQVEIFVDRQVVILIIYSFFLSQPLLGQEQTPQ